MGFTLAAAIHASTLLSTETRLLFSREPISLPAAPSTPPTLISVEPAAASITPTQFLHFDHAVQSVLVSPRGPSRPSLVL